MDLKKLPPSLLVALGLAGCGPSVDDDTTEGNAETSTTDASTSSVGPCLSPPGETVGPCLDSVTVGPCLEPQTGTVGPCLDVPPGTSTGVCLQPPPTTGSTGGDTDTDTDTDSDSDGGTDTGTTGGAGEGQAADPRGAILGRLLDSGVLPADVASKLRAKADE